MPQGPDAPVALMPQLPCCIFQSSQTAAAAAFTLDLELPEQMCGDDWQMLQVFAKCGVLKDDDDRKPKVKVYRDRETQVPKGDGLVTYLKEPSVRQPIHCKIPYYFSVRFGNTSVVLQNPIVPWQAVKSG